MKTAEQYFQELAACLGGLTDAERGSVLDYYREYAAEAGLDDYDRLVSHFGPPQGFAEQLTGELAAHRPASAPRCGRYGAHGASAACWTACLPAAAPARPRPGRAGSRWNRFPARTSMW